MLDLNELARLQEVGANQLKTLHGKEYESLQDHLIVLSQAVIYEGYKSGLRVDALVTAAVGAGLAAGIAITIQNGEVKER